jgi:hypothetical protein
VRDQHRQSQVVEAVEDVAVLGFHTPPGDDEHVVGQALLVQRPQHREQVWLDHRQHRVRGAVEQLDRRLVRAEVPVPGQRGDGFLVAHQPPRRLQLEVVEQVPHAVAAVERAADDVVQRQPGLAVLDHVGEGGLHAGDLLAGQQQQWAANSASRCAHGASRGQVVVR